MIRMALFEVYKFPNLISQKIQVTGKNSYIVATYLNVFDKFIKYLFSLRTRRGYQKVQKVTGSPGQKSRPRIGQLNPTKTAIGRFEIVRNSFHEIFVVRGFQILQFF